MAAPTVVRIESSQANSTATLPSSSTFTSAAVGDLCVITMGGVTNAATGTSKPTYTSGGADAGFTALTTVDGGNSSKGRFYGWWKVLTSSDFSSGNLKQFNTPSAASGGFTAPSRAQLFIYNHANGWDASTAIFSTYSDTAGFTANANQTLNGSGAPSRANVSVFCWASSSAQSTLQVKWDSGTAQDPYCDDGAGVAWGGGHSSRADSGSWTTSSTTVTDSSVVATDVGRTITTSPNDTGLNATTIQTVTASTSFTVNGTGASTTNSGTVTLAVPHYGTNTGDVQADYNLYDAGSGATAFSINVGASAGHAVAVYTFQVKTVNTVTDTGTMSGGGTLSATGVRKTFQTGTMSGGGLLSSDRTVNRVRSGTLSGGGVFSATPKGAVAGTGTFSGGGTFSATWAHLANGTFQGGGTLSAAGLLNHVRAATMQVSANLRGTGIVGSIPSGKSGTWEAGALIRPVQSWSVTTPTFSGGGVLSATGRKVTKTTAGAQFISAVTLRATGTATHIAQARFTIEAILQATQRAHGKPVDLDADTRITLDADHGITLDGTHAT